MDLKQVMYGTLLTRDGGVPLFGQALDGNAGDNHSAAAFFQRIRSLVEDPRSVCCVADSKGWCSEVHTTYPNENHTHQYLNTSDQPSSLGSLTVNGYTSAPGLGTIQSDQESVK
jgi:hypothetical protein